MIHRDLKPSNVIVGKYGETLVVDWGLAKCVGKNEKRVMEDEATIRPSSHSGSTDTIAGFAVGTPAFMSPEQAEGETGHVGFASDVYGLGATLYYLLTGQNPITDREVTTALRHARRGEFLHPREVNPEVPLPLEAICLKAMAYRAEDRFDSPRMLAHDLELWLAGEPVSAWPEPPWLKLRRWVIRNRTLVSSATAALLVALVTGGYLAFEFNMRRARRQIEANARVDSLLTAEVRSVPQIVEQLGADRSLVRERLHSLVRDRATSAGRIGAALALLPDDRSQAQSLVDRLIEAGGDSRGTARHSRRAAAEQRPGTVHRTAHRGPPTGWRAARRRRNPRARRAGAGPTRLEPVAGVRRSARHQAGAGQSVRDRGLAGGLSAGEHRAQSTVAPHLCGPLPERTEGPGLLAPPRIRVAGGQSRASQALAGLLPDADPDQFRSILRRLSSPADRERALAAILPVINAPAQGDLALAQRQARLAPALIEFSRAELVWPMLVHRDDPSLRTELIHIMADYEVDPKVLVERLKAGNRSQRTPGPHRRPGRFRTGAHPAAPARRSEGLAVILVPLGPRSRHPQRDRLGLAAGVERRRRVDRHRSRAVRAGGPIRSELVHQSSGQTFAIVRGPVSFRMGTVPGSDPYAGGDESPQDRTITRSFAIATREVSLADFRLFLKDNPDLAPVFDRPGVRMRIPSDDCAVGR